MNRRDNVMKNFELVQELKKSSPSIFGSYHGLAMDLYQIKD